MSLRNYLNELINLFFNSIFKIIYALTSCIFGRLVGGAVQVTEVSYILINDVQGSK